MTIIGVLRRIAKISSIVLVIVIGIIIIINGTIVLQKSYSLPVHTPCTPINESLYVYDANGSQCGFATITLETEDAFLVNNPINISIRIFGVPVLEGMWMYALPDGANASFPELEPDEWDYNCTEAIVLHDVGLGYIDHQGIRQMNYSREGTYDISIVVVNDTLFFNRIIGAEYIGGISITFYTVPKAVQVKGIDVALQFKTAYEDSVNRLHMEGISWIAMGIGVIGALNVILIFGVKEKSDIREETKKKEKRNASKKLRKS